MTKKREAPGRAEGEEAMTRDEMLVQCELMERNLDVQPSVRRLLRALVERMPSAGHVERGCPTCGGVKEEKPKCVACGGLGFVWVDERDAAGDRRRPCPDCSKKDPGSDGAADRKAAGRSSSWSGGFDTAPEPGSPLDACATAAEVEFHADKDRTTQERWRDTSLAVLEAAHLRWRTAPPDQDGWWWAMDAHEKVAAICARRTSDSIGQDYMVVATATGWKNPGSLGYTRYAGPIPEPKP